MAMKMRAKFKLATVTKHEGGSESLQFWPVAATKYGSDGLDEDNTFAKFSPSGDLKLTVCNPALIGKFIPGGAYYLDFTPVPVPAEAAA